MEEIERHRKNKNMALISGVSWMTWMTLRIITILLYAEGSFYEKDTLHLTVDYKDKNIRTGTDLYVNIIWRVVYCEIVS